jgi:hypothetical protein
MDLYCHVSRGVAKDQSTLCLAVMCLMPMQIGLEVER